jgi:hypothetical protein
MHHYNPFGGLGCFNRNSACVTPLPAEAPLSH